MNAVFGALLITLLILNVHLSVLYRRNLNYYTSLKQHVAEMEAPFASLLEEASKVDATTKQLSDSMENGIKNVENILEKQKKANN